MQLVGQVWCLGHASWPRQHCGGGFERDLRGTNDMEKVILGRSQAINYLRGQTGGQTILVFSRRANQWHLFRVKLVFSVSPSTTPSSGSRTLKGLFELTRCLQEYRTCLVWRIWLGGLRSQDTIKNNWHKAWYVKYAMSHLLLLSENWKGPCLPLTPIVRPLWVIQSFFDW